MKLLGKYRNGNYNVELYNDGTKIRETDEDSFIPAFAENCDVHISNKCDNGCKFCYANCTKDGEHGKLLGNKFLDTLHPYTEMALNLNFPPHPDLEQFLIKLKEKNVIANITVHQRHFIENQDYIMDLYNKKLFKGIGVSYNKQDENLINLMKQYKDSVLHVINGIITKDDIEFLQGNGLKVLILGYKDIGRGTEHFDNNRKKIEHNKKWLSDEIGEIIKGGFSILSFDNLSLEQLNMRRFFSDEEWEEFYMGDDGTVTFYIDLVRGTFSRNSLSEDRYNIMDSIDDMFKYIVEKEKERIQ